MAARPSLNGQSGGQAAAALRATAPPLWGALIILPRDRTKPGRLELRDRIGMLVFSCQCLGRSAGIFDAVTGRVRRDRLAYRGDTPLGDYAPTFVTTLAKPITGIGRLWVGLDPIAGEALAAEQAGRRGLGIHGGRGETLRPTHGCIRLKDSDMAALAAAAGRNRFTVRIVAAADLNAAAGGKA